MVYGDPRTATGQRPARIAGVDYELGVYVYTDDTILNLVLVCRAAQPALRMHWGVVGCLHKTITMITSMLNSC